MTSSDNVFYTLPLKIQKLIDNAFNLVADPEDAIQSVTEGGFMIDDGGFLPEEDSVQATRIRLSVVPDALKHLDLPPEDPEINSVFEKAASGWSAGHHVDPSSSSLRHAQDNAFVSRDDWRSVCAVLLEHRRDEEDEETPVWNEEDVEGDDSDEYQGQEMSPLSESGDDDEAEDSDDYVDGPRAKRKRSRITKRSSTPDSDSATLSSKQREICLKTFALFFPDVPADDLPNQKLLIADVQKVVQVLNMSLKKEDVSSLILSQGDG